MRYTLPENNRTILASQYDLYLPSEESLKNEMTKTLENRKRSAKTSKKLTGNISITE